MPRSSRGAIGASIILLLCSQHALAHEPDEQPEHGTHAPVLIERVDAEYPEAARSAGIGGTVGLELTVAADGAVSEVKVVRPAGNGLDESAVAAARRFRFRPATHDGKAIASTVLFDQQFVLRPHLTAETLAEPVVEQAPAPPAAVSYESTVQGRGPTSAASATTIREQDFDLRPKTSPNDILRVVPGLLAVQHQGGGKADQLFLRGFDADHGTDVAVFVDGVPVNLPSHAHGQGFTDLHWLIPEAVERIDVVKGPYDVRYGDFATAGAVNLVTRGQFDQSSLQLTLGGYLTRGCDDFPVHCKVVAQQRMVAIIAPKLTGWASKLHPWVAFEAARDDGPFISGQALSRYNLFAKISYDITPRTIIGAFISAYGSGWKSSGQIPSREVDAGLLDQFGSIDPSEGGETQRQMVTAFLRHKDAKHELTATFYYLRYRLSLWNDFTFFASNPLHGDEIEQDDDRNVTGFNVAYHVHHHWRSLSFRTTVGAQVRWDGAKLDLWDAEQRKRLGRHVDGGAFPFGNNARADVLNLSAYAEEDVVFNKYLRAIVGLRGDYFGFNVDSELETSGVKQKSVASPKATVVITPHRALDLYLNFGIGFHSNDARISVQEGRTTPSGSVINTIPRIYAGEIGARLTLWKRVSAAAALWASYLENESVFVGDAGAFEPSDPSRRFGLDVELRVQALSWLYFDWDLSYANSTSVPNAGNGGAVALAPRLYMTGGVTVKHPIGLRAGLRFRYLGDRPAFDESSDEYQRLNDTDPRRVNAEGWFVLDLYGAYRYRWFEAQAAIQNLTNTTWREAQFGNASCTRREVNALGGCTGVTDVHFTPGVPFNLQLTVKAYF